MNNDTVTKNKNQQERVQPALVHKRYRNIIFDLGAVLINFDLKEMGRDIFETHAEDYFEILSDAIKSPVWREMDSGLISPEKVVEKLSEKIDKEKLLTFLHRIPNYLTPLQVGINILQMVRQKGYKTYILSNLAEFCYKKIKDFDFIKDFDGTIYSFQHGCAKPDEKIYRTLLTTYNLKASECLFIDDLDVNIAGGNFVGIDGIVCKDHDYVKKQLRSLNVIE